MQTFGSHVDGYHDVADQMIHDLRRRAEQALAIQSTRKEKLSSSVDFEEHRRQVRAAFLNSIGGFPEEHTPLEPQIAGVVERGEYTIEKILYQSLPDFYVTSLLYLPKEVQAPAPAVVFVHGHSDQGKAYPGYQSVCIDLVCNGFVVMAIDPPGQGERFQYWDAEENTRHIGGCTTEHTHAGLQFVLNGASIARHFVWDTMRGMDYLETRPEVDPERIGLTGNSGGGTQTSYLMLSEPRFAAAVPATFPMTLGSYYRTGQPQDSEQIVRRCFVDGPDHDDFLTGLAPKPVLIGAAAYDFFPIEGTLEALRRGKHIYGLYDAEERIDIHIAPTRHSYSPYLREAAVNWFRRHLMDEEPNFTTGTPDTLAEEELRCTQSGQVLGDFPHSRTVFDLNQALLPDSRAQHSAEELRASVRQVLGVPENLDETIHPRIVADGTKDGYGYEKVFFFSAPDIIVTGVLIHPPDGVAAQQTDIVLFENGTNEIPERRELLEELLSNGTRLFVFDVRGTGAVVSRPVNAQAAQSVHGGEYRLACDAMMLGISTLGLRVFDVLRAYDYLRTRPDVEEIGIHGVGTAATFAYFASVLEPGICDITCADMLLSYRNLVETRYYDRERYNLKIMAWGMLQHFDLDDLLPCIAPRPLHLISPRRANGDVADLSGRWSGICS